MQCWRVLLVALGLSLATGVPVSAQDPYKSERDRANESTVFIATGAFGASYHSVANDIAVVTSDDKLRVVTLVTNGGLQNVRDLLYLRSIDLAMTNVRILNGFVASGELGPDLQRKIVYVAPLGTEEAHILVRPEFRSINELRGRRVNFHVAKSSSESAGKQIFQTLGIETQAFNMSQKAAIDKMRKNELDATVCFCPRSVPDYREVKPEDGFRFVEVPYVQAFEAEFLPGTIRGEDYPNVLANEGSVETIAMYTILVTLNWPKGSVRYNRNARFTEALFTKYPELLKPPRLPSWKSVNLAGKVPGWQRFAPAQEWLDRREAESRQLRSSFNKFLDDKIGSGQARGLSAADRERLFREFEVWSRKN
jgi:TRAP-type uncharacterized transport system substrate-binding protein